MADRNQYPMTMPTNFNPSLLQQHQIQQVQQAQQQQQQQQQQAGMNNGNLGGITNPEQARMWQQIQQAQKDFRTQNGSDMTGAQVNQQVSRIAPTPVLPYRAGCMPGGFARSRCCVFIHTRNRTFRIDRFPEIAVR